MSRGECKIFKFFFDNGKYFYIFDNNHKIYELNPLELTCDLANLNEKKYSVKDLYFEPFDYSSAEEVYQNLSLYCRETTAQILTLLYPLKNDKDVMLDLLGAIHNAASDFIPIYYSSSQNPNDYKIVIDSVNELLPFLRISFDVRFENVCGVMRKLTIVDKLSTLLYYDFTQSLDFLFLGNKIRIKKCENPLCRKYFVLKWRSNSIYCDFPSPQNPKLKCNDKQLLRYYGLNDLEADALRLSHSIYVSLQAAYRKKKTKDDTNWELEHFKKRNAEKKECVQRGSLSLNDYVEWLKTYPRS